MRRAIRILSMGAGLAAVGYMVWVVIFSDHGYLVYRDESARLEELQQELAELKQQRESLARRILRLRNDPDALEELVHRELGYVHPDEFMLIISEDASDRGGGRP